MTDKKIGISFGALAPGLLDQLTEQGLTMNAREAGALEADITAVNRLYLRSIITESEARRARKRLMKQITAKARVS